MSEVLSLFPVLFLVYVLQCIAAAPPAGVVFLLDSRVRGRLLGHSWFIASQYRLFLVNPFSPFSGAVYVCGFPFIFLTGPAGEICGVSSHVSLGAGSFAEDVIFDSPHRFTARSKQLLSDNSTIALLHSERRAVRLAAFLERVQSTPPLGRYSFLDHELRRMFALDALQRRHELFDQCTALLGSLCLSFFLFLFLLAPVAIYAFGLSRLWPILLLTLLIFSSLTTWAFHRARRRLYPEREAAGLQHFFAIALSPFAAIRAMDYLAADLFEDFHPIAVAFVLLPEKDFLKFAEQQLRAAKFLTHDLPLEKCITGFLSSRKFDPQRLLQPPAREDDRSRTYCPACLTQYVIEEGTCPDCGGVPLQQFPSAQSHSHNPKPSLSR